MKMMKNYTNLDIISSQHYVIVLGAKYLIFCNPWPLMLLHSFSWQYVVLFFMLCHSVTLSKQIILRDLLFNPYPMAFPYGKGMVLHFYQQQESSTTKTVHKVINKGLKTYV